MIVNLAIYYLLSVLCVIALQSWAVRHQLANSDAAQARLILCLLGPFTLAVVLLLFAFGLIAHVVAKGRRR